jgi:hypothetical protein
MGIRYGGRQKGTPNKRTVQRCIQAARGFNPEEPLPKEVMEEVMYGFLALARRYTPTPGEDVDEKVLAQYERWGNNAASVARMLAPFCHATYKAILMPDQHAKNGLLTDFYLNIFERQRAPVQIEAKPVNGNGKAE